jgi:predicted DNA-binding protein (MmcQ/YjbR family)
MPVSYVHPKGPSYHFWKAYFLSKPGVEERHPFDPGLPVYFVKKKMFATFSQEGKDYYMNLKCIPDWSLELRKEYPAIEAGYHMNKKHWNTLHLNASLSKPLVKKLVDCSYDLVSGKLKGLALKESALILPKKRI